MQFNIYNKTVPENEMSFALLSWTVREEAPTFENVNVSLYQAPSTFPFSLASARSHYDQVRVGTDNIVWKTKYFFV